MSAIALQALSSDFLLRDCAEMLGADLPHLGTPPTPSIRERGLRRLIRRTHSRTRAIAGVTISLISRGHVRFGAHYGL